jgi:predicted ATPase
LVVTDETAFIELDANSQHSLEKLSSGERHLLTFLTLFLIIGRTRTFFIIDEPEISLNMKWQRELLPLLSELCPQAQIIVATHSPSIAHKKSNYLAELI